MGHCLKSVGRTLIEAVGYLARVLLKLTLCVAALGVLIVVVIYATADSTSPGTAASLDALVATVHEHRISYYQHQDWCESVSSEAGNYANSDASTCGDSDQGAPFDARGTHLFNAVSEAADKAGLAPIRISLEAAQGRVSFAQVDVACLLCYASYVYSPGQVPEYDSAEHATVTPMSGHWYYVNKGI